MTVTVTHNEKTEYDQSGGFIVSAGGKKFVLPEAFLDRATASVTIESLTALYKEAVSDGFITSAAELEVFCKLGIYGPGH